jgi:hypothetical protein
VELVELVIQVLLELTEQEQPQVMRELQEQQELAQR